MDETKIPFTNEQLINALVVSYEGSGYNDFRKGLDISIDDSKLGKPIGWGEGEEGLPGIEPPTLTKDMREALIEELSTAFAKEGENVLSNLEPPEYLNDSIAEMQDSDWDQMEDKEKFAWTESHTDIVSNAQDEQNNYFGVGQKVADAGKFYMPNKIDPMQEGGSGADYTATQKVARHLSIERASQIMVERGIYDNIEKARADAKRMDTMLWNGWKGSSHNNEGQLLQKATAEELGGRLNLMMITSTTGLIDQAIYVSPGAAPGHAYDAVKAYVRGKWETSQFLLKKAGLETVELYRAVNIPDTQPPNVYQNGTGPGFNVSTTKTFDSEAEANKYMESQEAIHGKVALGGDSGYRGKVSEVHNVYRVASVHSFTDKAKAEAFATKYRTDPANPEQHSEKLAGTPSVPSQYSSAPPPDFTRLPDIQVERNGAASATTDRGVANKWDGKDGRVVLRASVPRTAVVSVPAYGINVEGEHEVVIAGTAWKGWDAWYGAAPQFDKVKIGTQFAGAA
jgi:hypothetical protein